MNIEIGSYEAKTRLPELLRGVRAGNHYTITSRGKPVADLRPIEGARDITSADAAVEQMRRLMLSASSKTHINVKGLIDEGRE